MPTAINLDGTDFQIASWVWRNLVPEAGQASCVQGELLRAIEKLRWEAQSNGNANWDDCFVMFVDLLGRHLLGEPGLTSQAKAEITADLDHLKAFRPVDDLTEEEDLGSLPHVEDDLYDRLTSHVVSYCRLHPQLVLLEPNPSQYR